MGSRGRRRRRPSRARSPSGPAGSCTWTTWTSSSGSAPPWRAAGATSAGRQDPAARESRCTTCSPGKLMNPPHSHSAEEEMFVVLEGYGTIELWPHPRAADPSGVATSSMQCARATRLRTCRSGTAAQRPRGRRGMRVLAYGTRDPNDIAYYPRSGKVSLRGVGVIGRLEQLDYWDGEDDVEGERGDRGERGTMGFVRLLPRSTPRRACCHRDRARGRRERGHPRPALDLPRSTTSRARSGRAPYPRPRRRLDAGVGPERAASAQPGRA